MAVQSAAYFNMRKSSQVAVEPPALVTKISMRDYLEENQAKTKMSFFKRNNNVSPATTAGISRPSSKSSLRSKLPTMMRRSLSILSNKIESVRGKDEPYIVNAK